MSVKTYDPGKVVVTAFGRTIQGFADGTFVKVSRATENFTKQVGINGEVTRSYSRDKSGEITLTLMQTSDSNDILSAAAAADEASPGTGAGIGTFQLKDLNGRTLLHADEVWVRKPADVENAKESGQREWVLDAAKLDMTVGGN